MIVLKHAHVYAPEDMGIQDLLIGEGKILAIEKRIDVQLLKSQFPALQVKELNEKAVVPGLIDPHVHITGGGGEDSFHSRVPELAFSDCVKAGVTTMVGVLGTDSRTRTVRNLIAKARGLSEEGLSVYCLTGSYEYPSVSLMGDPADDVVFLSEVLGVKLAISDHRCSNPSSKDLTELSSRIRIASLIGGKPGLVHLHTGAGEKGLKIVVDTVRESDIPVTHFMPTHIRPETPYVQEYLELGGAIDLTSGNDPEKAAGYLKYFLRMTDPENITVSSDANGTQPVWNEKREIVGFSAARLSLLDFLRVLVQKEGMRLSEALPFVTEYTAKRLKLYPEKGVLQVGSDADLLVLDENISLDSIMAGGKFLMENKEQNVYGTFEIPEKE